MYGMYRYKNGRNYFFFSNFFNNFFFPVLVCICSVYFSYCLIPFQLPTCLVILKAGNGIIKYTVYKNILNIPVHVLRAHTNCMYEYVPEL